MKSEIAHSSTEYQKLFHKLARIKYVNEEDGFTIYKNDSLGTIVSYGNPDTIQCGIGDYLIEDDFSIEYQYDTQFLHFGIIYAGVTYSVKDGDIIAQSIPSSFMSLEKMDRGIGAWRAKQHFKGIEFSINYDYLVNSLLPSIGRSISEFNFFRINTRYTILIPEITAVLSKLEGYMQNRIMTEHIAQAAAVELVELLLSPPSRKLFSAEGDKSLRTIKAGARDIKINSEDLRKINQVHEIIMSSAYEFKTIPMLAKEVGISEQKLKYGFLDYYKQTIWDFQNNIRMSRAAWLILNDSDTFEEISKAVGYHSQTAFYNAFKKWCGLSPGAFKKLRKSHRESL